jgi:hypothetical protein
MRRHVVTILFSVLVALQAVSTVVLVVSLSRLESIQARVSEPRYSDSVADQLSKRVLKVTICDSAGENCADTSVTKVSATPSSRMFPSDPTLSDRTTFGLVVTSPDTVRPQPAPQRR